MWKIPPAIIAITESRQACGTAERRARTENLHVVAVEGAGDVNFDAAHQKLTARLHDSQGDFAELVHPFHARGRALTKGVEPVELSTGC